MCKLMAAGLLLLALAAPAAADDPRTWALWCLDYIQVLTGDGKGARTPEQTRRLEGDLTRTECEIIKQGRVTEERSDGTSTWPDGGSKIDARNGRLLIRVYLCSRTTPTNPPAKP